MHSIADSHLRLRGVGSRTRRDLPLEDATINIWKREGRSESRASMMSAAVMMFQAGKRQTD